VIELKLEVPNTNAFYMEVSSNLVDWVNRGGPFISPNESFSYKEAALNPTNRSNTADEFEKGILEGYRSGRVNGDVQGFTSRQGSQVFYIARPMAVKDPKCLDCHTTPEAAPTRQVELYGREGGYGWTMGEVVAAQMVYVPMSEAVRGNPRDLKLVIGALAAALGVAAIVGVVLLRRA